MYINFYLYYFFNIAGVNISNILKIASNKTNSIISSALTAIIYALNAAETTVSQATT